MANSPAKEASLLNRTIHEYFNIKNFCDAKLNFARLLHKAISQNEIALTI